MKGAANAKRFRRVVRKKMLIAKQGSRQNAGSRLGKAAQKHSNGIGSDRIENAEDAIACTFAKPFDQQGALNQPGRIIAAIFQATQTFQEDGYYVALGDGGSGGDPQENAQNTASLLGKILRIDPNGAPYAIPSDNPFVATPGARPEIWMYGLRNPWRFSFDRATGDVWIADVGQDAWEEVDFVSAAEASGVNWGWDEREATHEFEGPIPEGARDPIAERPLGDYCALIGGFVYRGSAIASLNGAYLFSDNCRGRIEGIAQQGGALFAQQDLGVEVASPTTFGEGPDGELYVVSREGTVYRLVDG